MATTDTYTNTSAQLGTFRLTTAEATILPKTGFLEYLITGIPIVTARRMLNIPIQMFVSFISLISNLINIVIFFEIGFSDGVTITLFGVAVADLLYAYFILAYHIFDILDATIGLFPFEPLKVAAYQTFWLHFCFSDTATVLTVFNAVQKCACVAIPFVFKNIFTNSRAKYIVCLVYIAMFIIYLAKFLSPGAVTIFDQINNRTRLGNYFLSSNILAEYIIQTLCRIVLPFISQVIVISCTVCLSVKLKQAIRSRHSLISKDNHSLSGDQVTSASASKMKTSTKELQAIQTVIMVSAIFVICTFPDVLITFTNTFYAETEMDLLKLCSAVKGVLSVINTASNFLVYLNFNSKYRQAFLNTFNGARCRFKKRMC